jgi:hypothetical protein
MNNNLYRNLAQWAGWLSILAFILGGATLLRGTDIVVSGNDYWQAAIYLVLLALFASHVAHRSS